jgi:hypothetical protein
LLCSAARDVQTDGGSENRRFLESALALDNYNPRNAESDSTGDPGPRQVNSVNEQPATPGARSRQIGQLGRTVLHFSSAWPAKALPADPLSWCAFDLVLLSDGALSAMTKEQLDGLTKWVRAGGSVCVLPDEPIRSEQLAALETLLQGPGGSRPELTLDEESRLLVVSDEADPILMRFCGLGRVVLLPAVADLKARLSREELGGIVAFLWKVRRSEPVRSGKFWTGVNIVDGLQQAGIEAGRDEMGVYILDERYSYLAAERRPSGGFYIEESAMPYWLQASMPMLDTRLKPVAEPLLANAEVALLPDDIEMVPGWVLGAVLAGYVLVIGPIDYFVLGFFRKRKYTWLLFPAVTAVFTLLMITAANVFMSSEDTGGRLVITDLGDDGQPVRQTVLETLYFGSQTDVTSEHRSELIVPAIDVFSLADQQAGGMVGSWGIAGPQSLPSMHYSGRFPHQYSATSQVQQWSPKNLRTMTLEPRNVAVPEIDWQDASLVTTFPGRDRLRRWAVEREAAGQVQVHMAVYHAGAVDSLRGGLSASTAGNLMGNLRVRSKPVDLPQNRVDAVLTMLSSIPTMKPPHQGLFRIVSQLSPEGGGSLEDLSFGDSSDPRQWVLVIVEQAKEDFHVFRKLYVVDEESGAGI